MGDEEGCDLCKSLEYNHHLERLSLEGNMLGPKFLEGFSKTLLVNTSLRSLDLEGNFLTKGKESGIQALCEVTHFNSLVSENQRHSEHALFAQHPADRGERPEFT